MTRTDMMKKEGSLKRIRSVDLYKFIVTEAYEKMSKKRDTDYQLLCMTRKDKKKDPKEEAASSITDLIKSIDAIDITDVSSRKD